MRHAVPDDADGKKERGRALPIALQGTLKLLQHTQFVIVAVNLGFALDLLEDVLGPTAGHDAFASSPR